MSSPLAKLNKRRDAKKLAHDAVASHEAAIEFGIQFFEDMRREMEEPERRTTRVRVNSVPSATGWLSEIVLQAKHERVGWEALMMLVAGTKQDPLRATDHANATPVSFTTRLSAVIHDPATPESPEGGTFLAELWVSRTGGVATKSDVPSKEPSSAMWAATED